LSAKKIENSWGFEKIIKFIASCQGRREGKTFITLVWFLSVALAIDYPIGTNMLTFCIVSNTLKASENSLKECVQLLEFFQYDKNRIKIKATKDKIIFTHYNSSGEILCVNQILAFSSTGVSIFSLVIVQKNFLVVCLFLVVAFF
jgi:hypothetical protein